MSQTLALILYLIGTVILAVGSSLMFYHDDVKKKKQKDKLKELEEKLEVVENELMNFKSSLLQDVRKKIENKNSKGEISDASK